MEIKMDEAWKSIDQMVSYILSWCWALMGWMWPVILLCVMLSGVKEVLMIGDYVPNLGPPMYWLYAAGAYWLVMKAKVA